MIDKKNASFRCGMYDRCEHGCPQSESKCQLYSDRRECSKSMRQRKESARKARKKSKTRMFDPRYI